MSDVERLVDETREFDETIVRAVVLKVPESDEYPGGYKVRLHYGTKDDETLLRYDNSHGVFEKHEGNDEPEEVDLGYFEAYDRFRKYVREKEEVENLW